MNADGAALIVFDGRDHLKYKLFFGLEEINQESVVKFRFPVSQGTVGRSLKSGTYLFTPDYPHSPDCMKEFVDAGMQANLVVPLPGPEGFLGAMAIAWLKRSPGPLDPEALSVVGLFAALVGSALYREALEKRLEQQSLHDDLTGLPNRRQLMLRLAEAKDRAKRSQAMFAVGIIDLDGFKNVNDHFGHRTGDEVLVQAACRFAAAVRSTDMVCRLGGDEFVVILEGINSRQELQPIFQSIAEAANIRISGRTGTGEVRASIGATMYPIDAEEPEQLLQLADAAMYVSKSRGGNCVVFGYAADVAISPDAEETLPIT